MPRAQKKPSTARNGVIKRNGIIERNARGQLLPGNTVGFAGQGGIDAARARKALNLATIKEMHAAFNRGGRQAIDKVMKNAPAQFLKMLVLLVPRELEVTHSGGVKGMSDEQLERGIEALEAILSRRAAKPGDDAKVIEAQVAEPAPDGPSASDP
jgi:hypothetical protein